jgi:methyl halide transferase
MNDVNHPDYWQQIYRNQRDLWDLGGPTAVFARLAASGDYPPGRMMVLGAGKGHDARLFARHGFTVTAVDFAPEAVQIMRQLADPAAPVEVLEADIFHLPPELDGRYDYILDYTSFCAIDPGRREEYAAVVTRLLKRGGLLIMLAFPIGKRPGGPPFVVQPDAVIDLFNEHGFQIVHREFPPDSAPDRKGVEELLILAKGGLAQYDEKVMNDE